MKRSSFLILLAVLVSGCLSFRKAPPDLSSPIATVKSFADGIEDADAKVLAACVKNGNKFRELNIVSSNRREYRKLHIEKITEKVQGSKAQVSVEYFVDQGEKKRFAEVVALEKTGTKWQIVVSLATLKKLMKAPSSEQQARIKTMAVLVGVKNAFQIITAATPPPGRDRKPTPKH